MDPIMEHWLFHNWMQDQVDQYELARNHGYLIASFIDPESVKKIMSADNSSSTEEEFEQSINLVDQFRDINDILAIKPEEKQPHRRRRQRLK